MARGGARKGAGRKPLEADVELTEWIVGRLRRLLYASCMMRKRQRRWLRANGFTQVQIAIITGKSRDLAELREEMRNVPVEQRAAMVANPEYTPLGDVREVFASQLGGRRWHRIPEPTPYEMGKAYEVVARIATLRRGISLTRRNIKDWLSRRKKGL